MDTYGVYVMAAMALVDPPSFPLRLGIEGSGGGGSHVWPQNPYPKWITVDFNGFIMGV